jgi:hypothetical protein
MRWRVILAGGAVLLMLVLQFRQPGAAYACLCQNPSIEAEFDRSDAVFQGEVIDIQWLSQYEVDVTFDVSKGWKGSYKTMVIRPGGIGSCSNYPFVNGREYIVFASDNFFGSGSDAALYPLPCGYTGEVSSEMQAELTLIQPELQPLTGPSPFNPDDFIQVWVALVGLGVITVIVWRWRRATRPI